MFPVPRAKVTTEATKLLDFIKPNVGRILVITGAGVSTDSGIPDYRGAEGTYVTNKNYKPIFHQQFVSNHTSRQRYWARSFIGYSQMTRAKPNDIHRSITELEKTGITNGLITQNVDNLHREAGTENLLELHGNIQRVNCIECKRTYGREQIQMELSRMNPEVELILRGFQAKGEFPHMNPDGDVELGDFSYTRFSYPKCDQCHGILKPSVVFFGDNLDIETATRAQSMERNSDAVLVLGTTLSTLSSYRIVKAARERQVPVAIVNLGKTRADDIANLKFDIPCLPVVSEITRALVNTM
ncbi:DHS-like NAD/FAD-binding domain-containing protein [Basidiobolus meristosporus CBS 931.73]|uniref:DHS-like NAD/FAD-binding domain-containing protein n=1 Tax=Basidiobolus meristosporus CBS 931.73 TaxID=1314790 RepID=A0A1Y1ZBD6_9FUNG|nr:DHS-like NAD/FAD-binding domain-containing protein [Basidiobolus meristosporus CBS 931.73]|eukprot:ORY07580.1 DHS-like NAD/FAD-binding domain-containing protein [Basidiobolus meristosporus CBS 931.73]